MKRIIAKKGMALAGLVCAVCLTACSYNELNAPETGSERESITETEKQQPTQQPADTDTSENITKDTSIIETKTPRPDGAGAVSHSMSDDACYDDYEYNEESGEWDYVYVNKKKKIVWDIGKNEIHIEYDGKKQDLPWAMQKDFVWTRTYSIDVNQDGVEEMVFVVASYDFDKVVPFVFDVKNWKDLSPVYGEFVKEGGQEASARYYLRGEYAKQLAEAVNEEFERKGSSERIELLADGSLEIGDAIKAGGSIYDHDNNLEITGRIYVEYASGEGESGWVCKAEFVFEGTDCRMEIKNVKIG